MPVVRVGVKRARMQMLKVLPCTGIGKRTCDVDILSEALIWEWVKGWCRRRLSAYIGLQRIARP